MGEGHSMATTKKTGSMVQVELGSVQDGPEDVSKGFSLVVGGFSPLHEWNQEHELVGSRAAGQRREVEGFYPTRRVQEWGLDDRAKHLAGLQVDGAIDVRSVHHRQ